MRFRPHRLIEPEILDDQTPERAAPSLADIVRINRITGGHNILRRTFARLAPPGDRFTVLDAGAASGDAGMELRRLYPSATVISLDYRIHHLRHSDPPCVVADAFHLPIRAKAVDYVYCGLFLHHFTANQIVALLRAFAACARRHIIINDLERHILPYYFLPATRWILGWDPITVHDGTISVQAGFTRDELADLARAAGLVDVDARLHRPAFRISVVARCPR